MRTDPELVNGRRSALFTALRERAASLAGEAALYEATFLRDLLL